MYHVSAQGVPERTITVRYYYHHHYFMPSQPLQLYQGNHEKEFLEYNIILYHTGSPQKMRKQGEEGNTCRGRKVGVGRDGKTEWDGGRERHRKRERETETER